MIKTTIVAVLVLCCLSDAQTEEGLKRHLRARHSLLDRHWAQLTGLTPDAVRRLRITAGIDDTSDVMIDSLDTNTLSARKQILVVAVAGGKWALSDTARPAT
ncbi:MAG: hypothetical protein DMG57_35245 [Acidobacteria bacterium]|nr:MAG: hypothetical protein DMG57_35245 [Acidobacteriota bacterium]